MDDNKLANTIAKLTDNGHWRVIVAQELIDALADNLEAEDDKPCLNTRHCDACPYTHSSYFNRAKWTAKARGESC